MNIYNIIKKPVVTEKSTSEANKAVFRVVIAATKPQISLAVETMFGVKVKSVNTCIMSSKPKRFGKNSGRRSAWKKAIVTLQPGHQIEIAPGADLATDQVSSES
jgi:large subunit ribosomal protein L23